MSWALIVGEVGETRDVANNQVSQHVGKLEIVSISLKNLYI